MDWVKGSFFKQRRVHDPADLVEQLAAWVHEANTVRPSRATGVAPVLRRAEELPRLRPVRVLPADLALRVPVVVSATAYVTHDTHRYSRPPDAIGLSGTLYLYSATIRIQAGSYEARHARLWEPDAIATLPEHRSLQVAAVSGKRGKRYLQRQHLLELGPVAHAYLTELTHRRPRLWVGDVDVLHTLLQTHGAPALRLAFDRALAQRCFGAEYITHALSTPDLPL